MSMRSMLLAGLAAAALVPIPSVSAITVTLQPSQDTTIFSDGTGNASGAGAFAFAGTTAGGNVRRALFRFDLSDLDPGSIVTAVSFRITVDRATGGTASMSLHRVLAAWGEGASDGGSSGAGAEAGPGDSTWTHRDVGDPASEWRTDADTPSPGGYYVSAASAVALVGVPDTYMWTASPSNRMVEDVQGWIRNPKANFGWILIGDEAVDRSAKRFYSAEADAAIAALRPALVLEVTPVPEPGTTGLMVAGAVWLAVRVRCRRTVSGGGRSAPFGS